LIGTGCWAVVAAACLLVGSTGKLGWVEIQYRLENVLLASLVGAALGSAGAVYQAILRNPLADPYLLGVSSGASLLAFVWRLPFAAVLSTSLLVAAGQQAFSFGGALISVGIALLMATRRGRLEPITLLLVGVIINAINGAIFLLLYALFPQLAAGSGSALNFLIGGIQTNLTHGQEGLSAALVGSGWIVMMYLTGQLNAASLSEAEAQAMGVQIHRVRWIALIVASIVTAAAVAISGPIGFIGLICPHLVRLVVGSDQRRLIPAATAFGAALLACADAITRLLSRQDLINTVLPVGVLTALLGGPFFLYLLWRSRRPTA